MHEAAQPGVGHGHDRPVGRAVADDLDALLDRRQLVAAGAHRVEAVEQAGRGRARERDPRAALLARARACARRTTAARIERVLGARARSARA